MTSECRSVDAVPHGDLARSTKAEGRVSVDTAAASVAAAAVVVTRRQLLWLGSRSSERV